MGSIRSTHEVTQEGDRTRCRGLRGPRDMECVDVELFGSSKSVEPPEDLLEVTRSFLRN